MKVLVTGVNGFIGEHVAEELVDRDHSVLGIVPNFIEVTNDKIEIITADLINKNAIDNALQNYKFDVVIDAAAKIPYSNNVEVDYFDNVLMTRNLLEVLKTNIPSYFIKISTIDVYNIKGVISEHTQLGPSNDYSLSKLISEQLVEFFGRTFGISTCILRLTQIYGKGDRTNKFIPSMIRSVKEYSKVIIYGDGSDKRDLLHVKDVSRMIVDCCEKRIQGTLNLATGISYSLLEIVNIFLNKIDHIINIEYQIRKKDKKDYEFDISNLVSALGNIKTIPLVDGLNELYESEKFFIENKER